MKPAIVTLLVLLFSNFGFSTEANFVTTNSEDYITHEVFFATDKFNLSNEESQKLPAFVKEIKNIDIDRIQFVVFVTIEVLITTTKFYLTNVLRQSSK